MQACPGKTSRKQLGEHTRHRHKEQQGSLAEEAKVDFQHGSSLREEQRDFVAIVSHEFRTPLAIINTSIQQLSANLDAPIAKTQQRAQNIRIAVQRMNLLLDDYLPDWHWLAWRAIRLSHAEALKNPYKNKSTLHLERPPL